MKKLPKVRKNAIQKRGSRQIGDGAAGAQSPTSLARAGVRSELQKAKEAADQRAHALELLMQASGVKEARLGAHIVDQVSRTLALWTSADAEKAFKVAVELMLEIKPEDVMGAMLAVQMIGVHHVALSFLQAAAVSRLTSAGPDTDLARTANLMRLFMEQLEAMAKLKGKSGQQKVTVEHVYVNQGGQAIVGSVSAVPRGEGEGGNEKTGKRTP